MRHTIVAAVIALLLTSVPVQTRTESRSPVEVHFAPTGEQRKIQGKISSEIGYARKEVIVAMYHFTSTQLAKALAKAHRRGVKVRVMLDGRQASRKGSYAKARQTLEDAGVPLRRIYPEGVRNKGKSKSSIWAAKLHHKFCVIDGYRVLTGSGNWTVMADEKNYENLIILSQRKIAQQFVVQFEKIWNDRDISEEPPPR